MICRKATVALLDANPFIFEHINGIFVRFWPSGPPFSGISSTKSRFLCFFGLQNPHFRAFRAQNRVFCARLLKWMSGWGTSPPKDVSSHLPSRRICAAAVPSAVACSRLPPVPPVLPLLPPLHLRSRCTCAAAVPPAVARCRICAAAVPAAVVCRICLPPLHLTAGAG